MRTLLLALALVASSPALADRPLKNLYLEYEVGPAYFFQNDGRYGPTGTPYTAADVNQNRNLFPSQRLALEARLGERHGIILLYAPLDVTTRATLGQDIDFRGTVFRAGTVVDSRFLFDGYRASYLYRLVNGDSFRWDIGASFQVRNAIVSFSAAEGTAYALESDIGLVFALKTRLIHYFPWKVWAALEADALSSFGIASVRGGIYDVALTLGIPLDTRQDVTLYTRLRLLGGGADVVGRDIYNWGNFGFALIGIQADLASLAEFR